MYGHVSYVKGILKLKNENKHEIFVLISFKFRIMKKIQLHKS